MYILYIREKFRTSLSKKIGVNTCLGTDKKSVMMIRVKVKSKSELAEDREGKSALYRVICCYDDRLLSKVVIICNMWSYGLDLRSIKLTVVKVVVNSEGTCNNCVYVEVFN